MTKQAVLFLKSGTNPWSLTGRTQPKIGDKVFTYGYGGVSDGDRSIISGKVVKHGGHAAVRIAPARKDEFERHVRLSMNWTKHGEPHPDDFRADRAEQALARRGAATRKRMEAEDAKVAQSKAAGFKHLDENILPEGTPVENVVTGEIGLLGLDAPYDDPSGVHNAYVRMRVEGEGGREGYLHSRRARDISHVRALQKSFVVFAKANSIKNRPGLVLRDITDRSGKQTKRWEKSAPDEAGADEPGAARKDSDGAGTHHIKEGDPVRFEVNGKELDATVLYVGTSGVTAKTKDGKEFKVRWKALRAPPEAQKRTQELRHSKPGVGDWRSQKVKVSPEKFSAKAHYDSTSRDDITPDKILAELTPEQRKAIDDARARLATVEQTIDMHKKDGRYTKQRRALQRKIIKGSSDTFTDKDGVKRLKYPGFLTPEKIAAATPKPGERPTLTILGGRGGSGKGGFKNTVYDPSTNIVLDPDAVKEQLPEYAGWNAGQVHEESSEIFDTIKKEALKLGVNIVLDATMKTPEKALKQVKEFQDAGYRVEAHYMHLPRHMAIKRALHRFFGASGRLVDPNVIHANTRNEEGFDAVRNKADEWSFWDNRGEKPELISHSHARTLRKSMVVVRYQ